MDPQLTVGQLVIERPAHPRVFKNFGIDFCCGDKKPLLSVCREKSHDAGQVLSALEVAAKGAPGDTSQDWSNAISSIFLTYGCNFVCPYSPIPGYNQRQYRSKSGERIAQEMGRLYKYFGLTHFFGCDDNVFNDEQHTMGIVEKTATAEVDGIVLRKNARWYTEI